MLCILFHKDRSATEQHAEITIVKNTVQPANIGNLYYGSNNKYKLVYECLRNF